MFVGGESRSGKHNLEVVGSNPAPATRKTVDHSAVFFCALQFGKLSMDTYQTGDIAEQATILHCLKIPIEDFLSFRSTISFVEAQKRQRKPRSAQFREAWNLIEQVR